MARYERVSVLLASVGSKLKTANWSAYSTVRLYGCCGSKLRHSRGAPLAHVIDGALRRVDTKLVVLLQRFGEAL